MRALEFIIGHVIYNPAYTYKFQLKTTKANMDLHVLTSQMDTFVSVCLDILAPNVKPT